MPIDTPEHKIILDHVTKCEQLKTEVKITQRKLPTMYWIPKLHKTPYKARFIANSTSCTTTSISKLLISCLSKIKDHWQRYAEKAFENSQVNLFWSIKNSTEILDKLQKKRYLASTISTYDFSTLYTTLPHTLIKYKLSKLIEKTFAREKSNYLACNTSHASFTNEPLKHHTNWTCLDVCESLEFLLDNIFVRFSDTIY